MDRTSQEYYELVGKAISNKQWITVTYRNASGEITTNRKLAPLHIWAANNSCYLVAYCDENEQVRTFHLKRFQKVRMLPEKFENHWDFDMQKYAGESFGVFHAQPEGIDIWMDPVLRTYIQDHPLHASQTMKDQDTGLLVNITVGINESLVSRIMGFGSLARVLAPDGLAILVMERHRSACESYSTPSPVL